MAHVVTFIQTNWELVVAVVSLILSWIAVLKSQDAIQSSDKQFLFDRRFSVYMLLRDLVSGYEQAKGILPNDDCHGAPDFVYGFLCNVSSLEDIQGEARNWEKLDSQGRFMLKVDKIRKTAVEIRLLFPNVDTTDASKFIMAYADTLVRLRAYYVVMEEHAAELKKTPDAIRRMMPGGESDNIYELAANGEHGLNVSVAALHEAAKILDEKYFCKLEKVICLRERRCRHV